MANEETPGYKARQLPFRETFAAAMDGMGPLNTTQTHPNHIPLFTPANHIFHQTIKQEAGAGLDDNTVNLEKEMTLMAENTMLYMAVSQFLSGRFRGWESAINEGRGG